MFDKVAKDIMTQSPISLTRNMRISEVILLFSKKTHFKRLYPGIWQANRPDSHEKPTPRRLFVALLWKVLSRHLSVMTGVCLSFIMLQRIQLRGEAGVPVLTTPLMLDVLRKSGLMTRPLQPNQSTEFSFSRFLVPYLMNYQGWALFTDNDIIMLEDIANLWALRG